MSGGRRLVSLVVSVALGLLISATCAEAVTVNFGTLASFGGPSDLDLAGPIRAVDVSGNTSRVVSGVTFWSEAAAAAQGITVTSQNLNDPWASKPEYGSTTDDDNLEAIMWGIRWSASPNIVSIAVPTTVGKQYKVQLLFSENYWTEPGRRCQDINIAGYQGVDEMDTVAAQGGSWSGNPTRGSVYTVILPATAPTLNMTVSPGSSLSDKNPILNGFTIEEVGDARGFSFLSPYSYRVAAGNPHIYLRLGDPVGAWLAVDSALSDGAQNGLYRNDPQLGVAGMPGCLLEGDTAVRFDGVNDQVVIMDAVNPTAYTIEAWVMPESAANQSILVRTSSSGPTTQWSHQLRINNGRFEAYLYDQGAGTTRTVTSPTTFTLNEWHYVVAVAQNGADMKLYVDGLLQGSVPVNIMWTGGDRWVLGSNSGHAMNFFLGSIDEVAISSVILSAEEIRARYEVALGIPEPATLALLAMGLLGARARARRRARSSFRAAPAACGGRSRGTLRGSKLT